MSARNATAAPGSGAERSAGSGALAGLAWAFVAVGVLLRLRQYFFDRSFWLDECLLALNILDRSFGGLLRPLDHHQHAPVAFLLLEKSVCGILGTSERVLRLIPLLAAIVSLVLLRAVARRTVGNLAAVLAIALFALSEHLIYYSSELKQYSSDAAVCLLLLFLAIPVLDAGLSRSRAVALAAAGAAAIWFSHPSVFVLAGIALTAGIALLRRGIARRPDGFSSRRRAGASASRPTMRSRFAIRRATRLSAHTGERRSCRFPPARFAKQAGSSNGSSRLSRVPSG